MTWGPGKMVSFTMDKLSHPDRAGRDRQGKPFRPSIDLEKPLPSAILKIRTTQGGNAEERFEIMFSMFVFAVLSGLAALVAYEAIQEGRGSSRELRDTYHGE